MADQGTTVVASRYARGLERAVVLVVVGWHGVFNMWILFTKSAVYTPFAAEVGAWIVSAGIVVVGARLLLGSTDRVVVVRGLAVAALGAAVVATAACRGGQVLTSANWAWGTIGWLGVLLLLRRPRAELAAFLAAGIAITTVVAVADGPLDRLQVTRLVTATGTVTVVQVAIVIAVGALRTAARQAAQAASAQEQTLLRRRVADEVHNARARRFEQLRAQVEPLLGGLAEGSLRPSEASVQRGCAIQASRMRRLLAETDDVPDPLLHELRATADIAERRGVAVDLTTVGDVPELSLHTRRALIEPLAAILATTKSRARLTVVATPGEVEVSVIADSCMAADELTGVEDVSVTGNREGPQLWIRTRWRNRSRSE